jgi:Helicase conserved C-terminal domain
VSESDATTLERSPSGLRDELERYVREDLVGPLNGDFEEIEEPPIDRYLLGLLAPQEAPTRTAPAAPPTPDEEDANDLALPEDELATGDVTADSGEEGAAEDRPAAVEQLVPSSFGMTFALDDDCDTLRVDARWGAYERAVSDEKLDRHGAPQRVWRRRPCGGHRDVSMPASGAIHAFAPDAQQPQVRVRGFVRGRGTHRLVTLFLVNEQQRGETRAVERWLAQAELSVRAVDGGAVFVRRPIDVVGLVPDVDKEELAGLEMQYRDIIELAVGHGVAVHAQYDRERPDRGTRLTTAAMPSADVPFTEAPEPHDFASDPAVAEPFARAVEAFDMQRLAEAGCGELHTLLTPLADAYSAWIDEQERRRDDPAARLDAYAVSASDHIAHARAAVARMRAGIAVLAEQPDTSNDVADAFRFANHAMWQQRVHTLAAEERRKDPRLKLYEAVERVDEPRNRSWRPFQLAFILLNLPALADPTHPERSGDVSERLVDLLFFPTGGGKTEAYLGLTAFAIAIRRLQGVVAGRDGRDGVAVLMRYTLRLLTLQQFQRAAALLCACELRRRALYGRGSTERERRWGATPMRIGLWVGQASTPNRTQDAAEWIRQARQRTAPRGSSPMQLARCPWCGSELSGGRDIDVDPQRDRTLVSCSDAGGECPFTPRNSANDGLPVVVVDEEVYRLLPALVIATVDKLARMPWEGRVQALFGKVSRRCERHGYLTPGEQHSGQHPARGALPAVRVEACDSLRPPDLVIQDELHLISGPLGSLVGLYETAVDELASWEVDGCATRPKVIASTATIRRAGDQVKRLFDRRLAVFPPPGLDARDSFFALQRDRPDELEAKPGRRYLGVCAPGRRFKQVLIRVYVAQLRAAWRVLGNQPGEAADAYMTLVGYFNSLRELGGMRRLVEDDVQSRLFRADEENRGRLIIEELTSRKTAAEIPRVLDQLGVRRLTRGRRVAAAPGSSAPLPIDVLLATNMISVGVDVPRLGAMVVAGQPKSTSEYIQATSRVGRRFPGLVLTVYNWSRPRDLSHYETFCHYHRTLYRQVEALSVTPFAPRALDRGLTGVLAALLRLGGPEWNANDGAGAVDPADPRARRAREAICERGDDQISPEAREALDRRIAVQLDEWAMEAAEGQRRLVYERRGRSGADVGLLRAPDATGWSEWTVPNSLRNVELAVPLALREHGIARVSDRWEAPAQPPPAPPRPADDQGGGG